MSFFKIIYIIHVVIIQAPCPLKREREEGGRERERERERHTETAAKPEEKVLSLFFFEFIANYKIANLVQGLRPISR